MKKVLVTGAGGFLGRHLVECLLDNGYEVRSMDRSGVDLDWAKERGSEVVHADIVAPDSFDPMFTGIDIVIHTAAIFDLSVPLDVIERVNVQGTENVCNAAVKAGVERFIMFSSVAVYGKTPMKGCTEDGRKRPKNNYAISKWKSEQVAMRFYREKGLKVTVVRPSLVYGPRGRYGQALFIALFGMHRGFNRMWFPVIKGGGHVNYIHVEDLVRAVIFLMEREDTIGQAYNLSDDRPVKLDELMITMMRPFGIKPRTFNNPFWSILKTILLYIAYYIPRFLLERLNRWFQRGWRYITRKYDLATELNPRLDRDWFEYLRHSNYSHNKKLKNLGFEFKYPSIVDGLPGVIQWYKGNRWLPNLE